MRCVKVASNFCQNQADLFNALLSTQGHGQLRSEGQDKICSRRAILSLSPDNGWINCLKHPRFAVKQYMLCVQYFDDTNNLIHHRAILIVNTVPKYHNREIFLGSENLSVKNTASDIHIFTNIQYTYQYNIYRL